MNPPLPVDEVLPEIVERLQHHHCLVLRAPAGAGKTTRVPPAILDQGNFSGKIMMLQPRRIAARASAARMAFERGERVGDTVGYRVRFDDKVGRDTRIVVMTEGILLRRLLDDPFLEDVSVVIFDEFHERRLESDLALAMTRRIQQTVRPDLKIVVMSATLAPAPVAAFLGDCPTIECQGRTYPIRIHYSKPNDRRSVVEAAVQGIERVLNEIDGDVLVFLPGVGEIHRTQTEVKNLASRFDLAVMPLYGDLSPEDQDRVLRLCPKRKLILSTNVAETSVTIDGITAVVDTGYARQMLFDPSVGLDRLELIPISKASADQRAGRAGRTGPGLCLRLWDEASHRHRPDFEVPELNRVDLSSAVLRLYAWGESDVMEFPWYERPPADAIQHASRLLTLLGAVNGTTVTQLGLDIVRLPVSPRLARLLIEGQRTGISRRTCLLAAMLSERDPFQKNAASSQQSGHPGKSIHTVSSRRTVSDVLDRVAAFEAWERRDQSSNHESGSHFGPVHIGAARTIQQVARQLEHSLPPTNKHQPLSAQDSDTAFLKSLVAAFPDRVTRRREPGSTRGLMVGGRGVQLAPSSAVAEPPLFLSIDIDDKGANANVRLASVVDRTWLPPELIRTSEELFFHPSQHQIVARRCTWFADLCLEETPTSISNITLCSELLYKAARTQFDSVFPANNQELNSFLMRTRCLAGWMPELELPRFDQEHLDLILKELCERRRSFTELRQAPWLDTLQASCSWQTRQLIDKEAPEKLQVPSGNKIRITYEAGKPPVLAVRIQEVFGWKQTPRIAGGRIPLLLHLLAPNMRPQQITDDLASFWANTYAEVRKDLRRRYPKHNWPEPSELM
ncbi:MAG: DEAD/DEAH box helicase [Planctomyces sp.]|nr:DEAD/DEAH box helicase [Planctomyces sp.]